MRRSRNIIERKVVPAVLRDRRVGGGAGGPWRVLDDVVESSAEESAGILSLGVRTSGMVNTGRSAVNPEMLEIGFCAGIPRGRQTPVNVRRRDRWGSKTETMKGLLAKTCG